MPNLKVWIEAQLKRGYTKEQIKKVLSGQNYPPSAVAQVDKIEYSIYSPKGTSGKKAPKKFFSKPVAIGVIIIVAVAVLLSVNRLSSTRQEAFRMFCLL